MAATATASPKISAQAEKLLLEERLRAPFVAGGDQGDERSWVQPAPVRPILATALGIIACQAGHRVAFATAVEWVSRLGDAHSAGRLQAELTRLGRIPLLVIDQVGYIPLEAEAANLFFQLISSRYERASLIVTSNKPFARWGETFGDPVVAAAMIDRLLHHAEVVNLKGDSDRLKDRDLGRVPNDDAA